MNVEHLAIDGSVVTIEAEADLSTRATAAGWAIVPSLMRSHPFTVFPPGYTRLAEDAVRANPASVEILSREEFRLKDGALRVVEARARGATGGSHEVTFGAWEGETGCLVTSLRGRETKRLVEVFDTLKFRPRRGGLAIDSPVMPVPRTPEVITEIPGVAVLAIRPALAGECWSVTQDARVRGGRRRAVPDPQDERGAAVRLADDGR